ncbi:MAG: signal peptidase I [Butyrivibrio sp.]|nr:signal peptidase I [Butyrivibrio sp.]
MDIKTVFNNFIRHSLFTIKKSWIILAMAFTVAFVIIPANVPSASMEPTLMTGDYILIKARFIGKHPKRGEIVSFCMGKDIWIKRLIGLPGDKVSLIDGDVYVNDEKLNEDYLPEGTKTEPGLNDVEIYYVPEGQIFVLGDNRGNSFDSRYMENTFIPLSDVIGYNPYVVGNIPIIGQIKEFLHLR